MSDKFKEVVILFEQEKKEKKYPESFFLQIDIIHDEDYVKKITQEEWNTGRYYPEKSIFIRGIKNSDLLLEYVNFINEFDDYFNTKDFVNNYIDSNISIIAKEISYLLDFNIGDFFKFGKWKVKFEDKNSNFQKVKLL